MPDTLWFRIACVALAGAAGSLLRWVSYELLHRLLPERMSVVWHVGTLAVNAAGCLIFGFLIEYFRHDYPATHPIRLLAFTGFLGAFTTYSTFAADTFDLQKQSGLFSALAFVAAQVFLGWMAMIAGAAVGQNL
ncbi:MAG: CrcB family protein [Pirellulales bacterium]|nr:CrcB family protein [Pirellulales bacterium]